MGYAYGIDIGTSILKCAAVIRIRYLMKRIL